MRLLFAFVFVVPLTLVASGQEGKKVQPDTELQGKWRVVSFETDGKKEDEQVGHFFVFQGDKFNTPDDEMRFQLDPGKKPKQIDAKGKSPQEGFPPIGMVGIYKVEGDKLTLCYVPLRKDERRPTEFKSTEGRREALVVLQRVKAKGPDAVLKRKFSVRCLNKDSILLPDELGQLNLKVELSFVTDQEIRLKAGEFRATLLDARLRQLDELILALPEDYQQKTFKKGENKDVLTLSVLQGGLDDGQEYYVAVIVSPGGADGVYPTFLRLLKFKVGKTAP